jgi:hypothetical protein
MTVLKLTDNEREILKRALESFEDDLRSEIVRTDKREWKTALHNEEAVVKKILEKVSWQ